MTTLVLQGDARTALRGLPDGCVQCVVTSPPFFGLRDYGTATWQGGDPMCDHAQPFKGEARNAGRDRATSGGTFHDSPIAKQITKQYSGTCLKCGAQRVDQQIGLEKSPDEFVTEIVGVFREVRRVMRADAIAWLNLGDSYSAIGGNKPHTGLAAAAEASDGNVRQHSGPRAQFTLPPRVSGGAKPKDLLMIPARVAIALQADGWWVRSKVIWHKPNPMPESTKDRPTSSYEEVFMLTKSVKYFFDADAVKESAKMKPQNRNTTGRGEKDEGYAAHRKAPGMTNPDSRNIRNVWTIVTSPFAKAHFATFPPALVEPCIKASTSEHGRCNVCGAPFRRIVQKGDPDLAHQIACGSDAEGNYDGLAQKDYASAKAQNASDVKRRILAGMVEKRTIGWKPTCLHLDATPIPCLVLDPFGGSGTVGVVANRLGRDAILYDLNPEYVTMAEERIEEDERKRGVI